MEKDMRKLAHKIQNWLIKKELQEDVRIYFNDVYIEDDSKEEHSGNPKNYMDYYNRKTITMSFEGSFYHVINGSYGWKTYEQFRKMLEKEGFWFDLGNAWNLALYTIENSDLNKPYPEDIEPEKVYISWHTENIPAELKTIADIWMEKSREYGDVGSCVIGAGFEFLYKNTPYFMFAQSPWQGSISWESNKDEIQQMLINIGCENIYYNWGVLD